MKWILIVAAAVLSGACCNRAAETAQTQLAEDVFAKGSLLENNPNFTGDAWLEMFVTAADSMDCTVGNVTFAPGMRIRAVRFCSALPAGDCIRKRAERSASCVPATW